MRLSPQIHDPIEITAVAGKTLILRAISALARLVRNAGAESAQQTPSVMLSKLHNYHSLAQLIDAYDVTSA